MPAANVPFVNTIRCPSTNDNAAASSSVGGGCGEGEPPARQQRQDQEPGAPAPRTRSTSWGRPRHGAASTTSIDALDRGDDDEHVEAEPPREQSEPLHTRTVTDGVISNLLLEDEFRIGPADERESALAADDSGGPASLPSVMRDQPGFPHDRGT